MEESSYRLGTEKLSKLIVKFSLPCIVSLVITALYNIVDQIFIGNSELSTLGNAATGAVFPFFVVAQGFSWCFGDGCAAFLNLCQGMKEDQRAHRAIGTGILMTVAVSFLLMAIGYPFAEPLLFLFGASKNNIGMATEYLTIILAFFPVFMLSNMLASVIRADGSPGWAMASTLAGAAVNLILDPVFIFGLKAGMSGAAWATVIGQTVSLAICVFYCFRTKTFHFCKESFLPDFKEFFKAVRLGMSSFMAQMTIAVIATVGNRMLAVYGSQSVYGIDIPMAVMSIESKVYAIVINIIVGFVLGCQPVISYNYGAEKYDRVKKLWKYSFLFTMIVGIGALLLFELAPKFVVGWFGEPTNIENVDAYWEFAERLFRIFLALVVCTCFIKMSAVFFQAVGRPVNAVICSLVRDIVCYVPLMLILTQFVGIDGVLYAAPIADAVGFAVAVGLTVAFWRSLKKKE